MTVLTMLTVVVLTEASLLDERHTYADQAQSNDTFQHFPAQVDGVVQGRGGENFVENDDAARCRLGEDPLDPDQVIFEFAPQVHPVFFTLEMRVNPVRKEQPGPGARNGQAEGGEVMQLADGPGEGGLPALVRAGDNEDPFSPCRLKIIGDHRRLVADEFHGQCQVERVRGAGLLEVAETCG